MRGQWLGSYTSSVGRLTVQGKVMVNIDEVGNHFEAVAYLAPSSNEIPYSVAHFSTPNKAARKAIPVRLLPIDPRTHYPTEWNDIKALYPEGVKHSSQAVVDLNVEGNTLHVDGVSDIDVSLEATLTKPSGNGESKIQGEKMSWEKFKWHLSSLSGSNFLYRGQQKPWSLCTSFHRRGRYRMSEFTGKDVRQLHQRLSAITSHFFDLTVPDQNGAFFNLLQHHGYPTPLLDWSRSPYVATFFAFRDRPIGYDGNEFVRIYTFNHDEWMKRYRQIQTLDPPYPHLSVMEFIAISNPRAVPQQAVTTVTNLHDIEAYVLEKEAETGVRFLSAIDIPANEREVAMRDLRFMGITAGSMFPGIEGVCEEFREINFDH